jgi:sensor histidine kinase YesM
MIDLPACWPAGSSEAYLRTSNKEQMKINRHRIRVYLWIAAAYLLLMLFKDLVSTPETFLKRAWNNIWLISFLAVNNFILLEYTLPFIKFTWKRILLAPVLLWGHLMLYSFGFHAWRSIGIGLNLYFPLKTYASTVEGVESQMPYSIFSIVFFAIVRHVYDYRKLKEATQQLRIEKQEAELNYLKSQTNPHFLFNTLNNIYALSRDKSDLAPESILRLSKILRFMLYETGGDYIAIEQELKIMNDYIALEKLRYDYSLRVNFNYDIEDMKQALPPLLLIPLVENAFKHGVSETRDQPFVDIHVSVRSRLLLLVVKNSADAFPGEQHVKENIGLSNLRRQLELLYKNYDLSVRHTGSVFTASLKINLDSHV